MGRLRFKGLIAVVVACAALCVPAASAASGFTWGQPGDFTATGSGSNPEHKYGEPSWSYAASGSTLGFSSGFAGDGGTYAGWVDSSSSPSTWIGVKTGGSPSTLQMVPAQDGSVSLTWTSPFSSSKQITVSGSVTEPNFTGALITQCDGTTWSLTNGGNGVANGSGATGTISSQPVTVSPGGTLVLKVSDSTDILSTHDASCDDTEVALALTAAAPASAITLTTPTSNQTFTSGQPTFAGAAGNGFPYEGTVKVRVYGGSSTSGTLVQTETTTESGGSWSVPAGALSNGTYTAQAEQDDALGDVGESSPVTFTINNPTAPTVTLNSLGSSPLTTSTPTLTGTAGTASGDSEVSILISSTGQSGKPVSFLTASVGSGGSFSVQVPSALADGQYTATAYQQSSTGGLGESSPITFTILVNPPALTLTSPANGASLGQNGETFSGTAGDEPGDSSTVTVTLWSGTSAKGKPLGTEKATVNGSSWRLSWPKRLALGFYTVQASQTDDAGHTTTTPARTFLIVAARGTVGSSVTLSSGGTAAVSITCLAPAGDDCRGDVLVLTTRSYQPVRSGPRGPVRVLFAYINIPGETTVVVRRGLNRGVARALLRHAPFEVRVTATLTQTGGKPVTSTVTRKLKKS